MERIRVNAGQTAKGVWSFDATIETSTEGEGTVHTEDVAKRLLDQVNAVEKEFIADGKVTAGALPGKS